MKISELQTNLKELSFALTRLGIEEEDKRSELFLMSSQLDELVAEINHSGVEDDIEEEFASTPIPKIFKAKDRASFRVRNVKK